MPPRPRTDGFRRAGPGGRTPAEGPVPNPRSGVTRVSTPFQRSQGRGGTPRPGGRGLDARPAGAQAGATAPEPIPPPPGARTLERRLLGWLLALTVAPALIVLAVGGWVLAGSLDFAGTLGPWEEVAESGRGVVERVEPSDPAAAAALAAHRDALSRSLTQARRWAFLGERFIQALPWLVLLVAIALVAVAYAATRQLARQLAQPIGELVVLAERLGRGEPLPPVTRRSVYEVRVLDDALRNAAAELEAAHERAVAAERLRVWGEMARRVAHEMKNPLTPIRFALHRLERGGSSAAGSGAGRRVGVPADEGFGEAVEVIGQEVERLEDLAAQFSSLGRPPEGPPTEVDVVELMETLLTTDATDVAWRVRSSGPVPPVLGHFDALLRAFRNLVRNAVEAMDAEAEPRLDVAVKERVDDGRWLEVRIRDHGPGLPPEGPDRIFEPDFTTKTRGTGLGLTLVRQAIVADGGTIRARTLEDGAEFVVRLPAVQSPSEEERP